MSFRFPFCSSFILWPTPYHLILNILTAASMVSLYTAATLILITTFIILSLWTNTYNGSCFLRLILRIHDYVPSELTQTWFLHSVKGWDSVYGSYPHCIFQGDTVLPSVPFSLTPWAWCALFSPFLSKSYPALCPGSNWDLLKALYSPHLHSLSVLRALYHDSESLYFTI